ncbi:MAG: hypothetical protein AABX93_03125 [Nanoarchaeota archaeon]|mgnify:CR=1 FL=1
MPEYVAKIIGTAIEYSFGGSLSYDVNEERRFSAEDKPAADKKAQDELIKIGSKLLCAKLNLESLTTI